MATSKTIKVKSAAKKAAKKAPVKKVIKKATQVKKAAAKKVSEKKSAGKTALTKIGEMISDKTSRIKASVDHLLHRNEPGVKKTNKRSK